jgi:SAM-dependent methyltransferase
MDSNHFEEAYANESGPWDIDRPQPEIVRLAASGAISGSVLDAGCGTGQNALFLAGRGHEVWGIDFIPRAIDVAIERAAERKLAARFEVHDALELGRLERAFDTVIDSGLFHTFDDVQRARYLEGLKSVTHTGSRVHILCFSEHEPPGAGPRRIRRSEIDDAFRDGWRIDEVRETRFAADESRARAQFSPGGPRGFCVSLTRLAESPGVQH